MATPENKCGECNMCCKLPAIPDLPGYTEPKPMGKMCDHCTVGVGCQIYESRPEVCSEFSCLWLESQRFPEVAWPLSLRPDRCHVMVACGTDATAMAAFVNPARPEAWKKEEVSQQLASIAVNLGAVIISLGTETRKKVMLPHPTEKDTVMLGMIDFHPMGPSGIQYLTAESMAMLQRVADAKKGARP